MHTNRLIPIRSQSISLTCLIMIFHQKISMSEKKRKKIASLLTIEVQTSELGRRSNNKGVILFVSKLKISNPKPENIEKNRWGKNSE